MNPEKQFYVSIGADIRKSRYEYKGKMSQDDLGLLLGVSANTVSRWETGVYKPSIYQLARMEEIFKVGLHLPSFIPNQTGL